MINGYTLNDINYYDLHIKDNYDFEWKHDFVKEYNLKLYFMDNLGNNIVGKDISFIIGENEYPDDPYSFGYVPISGETTRGKDLLKELKLDVYTLETGEKYEFDHAEVLVDGVWQSFLSNSTHWDIWCQYASSSELKDNYGWQGKYGDNVSYTINENTEYKLVYKLVRYGEKNKVSSLDSSSGISFKMFNYFGDNNESGINANGLYNYFTFRGNNGEYPSNINPDIDADGFTDKRAKVLPNLLNGYPVFDCRGYCDNKSLGYLFGEEKNPLGSKPVGVIEYNPVNTLLQKETINGVEYYYYDSNRNAVDYDTENNQFMLRNYLERGYNLSSYPNEVNRYEFMPFNYWNDEKSIKTIESTGFTYNYEKSEIDHWFGMVMEFNFYMPKNGMINEEDMIFSFSGDDDVWVFVDDVLVLDLGGTHGAVDGNINFKTGQVEAYLNWNNVVGDKNETSIYESFLLANKEDKVNWNESNTTFENYSLHTVKFFYLERGQGVSNCKIRFNIPVLPSGSLSVQKLYEGNTKYDDDYEFSIFDVTSNQIVKDISYTIDNHEYNINSKGIFTLKKDEVAVFKLTNNHQYYVKEINPKEHSVFYKCSLNNIECKNNNKTETFEIKPDSYHKVVFTNKVKTYNLKITKNAYDSTNENFSFKLNLDNSLNDVFKDIEIISSNKYEINHEKKIITFNLMNDEIININNIPLDTLIKLEETFYDGYNPIIKTGDIILSNNNVYEFNIDSDKELVVLNIPGVMLPETGCNGGWLYLIIGSILLMFVFSTYSYFKLKEGGEKN